MAQKYQIIAQIYGTSHFHTGVYIALRYIEMSGKEKAATCAKDAFKTQKVRFFELFELWATSTYIRTRIRSSCDIKLTM